MIELRNISVGYGKRIVSQHLSATLKAGQVTVILGPNGVGKSTLLRTVCGMQQPLEGEVLVNGISVAQLTPRQMSRQVGMVLTERIDVQGMRVKDLVCMGRTPYTGFFGKPNAEDWEVVEHSMQQVGIMELQHRLLSGLSDGERQKAFIAKVLAQQTPIILLDEPTAFLDFPSKVEMMRLLCQLAHEEQKAILLSTHDVEIALRQSDMVWLLRVDGVRVGTPSYLSESGDIASFFSIPGMSFDAETRTFR